MEDLPALVKTQRQKEQIKVPKTISLKELLNPDTEHHLQEQELPKTPYTLEQLHEAWMDFAYQIKNKDLDYFSTLNVFTPKKQSNNLIVEVHNSTQMSDLQKLKAELIPYLRKSLNNYEIDFEIIVNQEAAKYIAVTPQEKYKKMVEKNQLLEELRKKLDLGF